jgi:hypothetical protein
VAGLKIICEAQGAVQAVVNGLYSEANFFNNLIPPQVTANVWVDGMSVPSSPATTSQYSFQAAFKGKISSVTVSPAATAENVGETIPLGASAAGQTSTGIPYPIISSTLHWSWNPNPSDNYLTVTPLGTSDSVGYLAANKLGVALANVSG